MAVKLPVNHPLAQQVIGRFRDFFVMVFKVYGRSE